MKLHVEEEEPVRFEKFTQRKSKQRPKDSNHAYAQKVSSDGEVKFDEPGLQALYDDAIIADVVRPIRRGKEASVCVCTNDVGTLFAAKVYTDLKVRSFRNDSIYREGRFVGTGRFQKAINQHSRTGVDAQQALWIAEEFRQMKYLLSRGVSVPKPIAQSGRVILMEFIGDQDAEAPRLSEAGLSLSLARKAFVQSIENLKRIAESGRIHCDYSAFNLLWWKGRVVVIDFPQVVEIQHSKHARDLLRRDVEALCSSFKRIGVESDLEKVFREVDASADWRR